MEGVEGIAQPDRLTHCYDDLIRRLAYPEW